MSTTLSGGLSLGAVSASPSPLPATVSFPLPVLGADLYVPLVNRDFVRYVNLDYAASTPCLSDVYDALMSLLPWYSSVHRGAGYASTVSTEIYAGARASVADFVGARPDDAVVFTRNTTDALNLLAAALPEHSAVVTFASEHHANLLPWQRGRCVVLPVPASQDEAIGRAEVALRALSARHKLLAVSGASNVTGELWPIAELAAVAHRHGARLAVDAAQLAPHRPVDMAAIGIDYLALSAHKLYAPFGAGALVGRCDWLDAARSYLAGGGAVRRVTVEHTDWVTGPARHEAGSPNVLGAAAFAAACRALARVGMANVAAYESSQLERLFEGLSAIPGVEILSMWGPASPRVGVASFTVEGWNPSALAAALSAEHGIGVRDGAFCAHPLVSHLVERRASCGAPERGGDVFGAPKRARAVRASIGVGTSAKDIERFVSALTELTTHGARWRYRVEGGRYVPDPDPRPRPRLHRDVIPRPRSSAPAASTARPTTEPRAQARS